MKSISIILIAIVISIVVSTHINGEYKFIKPSLLKAFTNLDKCDTTVSDEKQFTVFAYPAGNDYVLYHINDEKTKYSFIHTDQSIIIVELKTKDNLNVLKTIDYYTSTSTPHVPTSLIHDITGEHKKHLVFNDDGTKLTDQSIFDVPSAETKYNIQLVIIQSLDPPHAASIQSTCDYVVYPTVNGKTISDKAKTYISYDYISQYVKFDDRKASALTYTDIKDKRMTKVDDKKYTTFYTKDNEMCSISYDGVKTYTLYYSKHDTVPTFKSESTKKISVIPEPPASGYKSYSCECTGDIGSKKCTKSKESAASTLGYTMAQSLTNPYTVYIFKEQINYGSNATSPELPIEPAAIDEFSKTWAGCVSGIQKINKIGLYKYNIIILFIISLIYIL